MKNFTCIDLFCGAGGLSKGFLDAGFDVLLGVDSDTAALKTFEQNHLGAISLNADLSEERTFEKIKEIIGIRELDVVIAGPPCQGFSLTGARNFDDKRNKLYLSVIEIVKKLHPKAFIIENVPGMATLYHGQVKTEIIKRFTALGYNVDSKILCAADYGVPQIRKRLIFMGVKGVLGYPHFPLPKFHPQNYRTCREAISDLPERSNEIGKDIDEYVASPETEYQKQMRQQCCMLYNHVATNHTKLVTDTISLVPEGGNYKDLPPGWGESRKFNEAWTRYHGDKPSRTIDTGHRNHFHYKYNRVPTVRENARLQSFPDNFIFYGTKTQQYKQVGNAVPPLLGKALAQELIEILGKNNE